MPESSIEKRKASQNKGALSREVRKRAGETRTHNYFAKLAERGIHRCPECWATQHRAIEFKSPVDLRRRWQSLHYAMHVKKGDTPEDFEVHHGDLRKV